MRDTSNKIIVFCLSALFAIGVLLPAVRVSFAAETTIKCDSNGVCLPESPFSGSSGIAGTSTVMGAVTLVLRTLLTVVGVIAVLWLIVLGFQYMTAGGNEEQAEKARKAITNAIIGLIVVVLSYAIVKIVTDFLIKGTGVTP